MTITQVAASAGTSGGGTSTSFATDWGGTFSPATDDFAIITGHVGATNLTMSLPAGWNAITGITNPTDQGTNSRFYIWWKVLSSGEAAPTITGSGSITGGWTTAVYRGVDTSSPIGQAAAAGTASVTSRALPSLTGVLAASMLHGAAHARVPSGTGPTGLTWNAAYTESADAATSRVTTAQNLAMGNAYRAISSAGNYGGETVSVTNSVSSSMVTALVELKAAITSVDLVVNNAAQEQTAGTPTLTQTHVLGIANANQAQVSDTPALTQAHALGVAGAVQSLTSESPALTQVHALAVQDATHTQAADNADISVSTDLVVQDAGQAQTAEMPSLTQDHNLTANSAAQTQASGAPTLTQVHHLAVDAAAQAQTAEQVSIAQAHNLAAQDVTQAQTSSEPALTQVHVLSVDSALHDQMAENTDIEQSIVGDISPLGARHSMRSDTVQLTQSHNLAVQNVAHAQAATAPTLERIFNLAVDSATQALLSTGVALTQLHLLVADSAVHEQAADNADLTQTYFLLADDAFMSQLADLIALDVDPRIHLTAYLATDGPVTGSLGHDGPVIANAPRV